MLHIRAHCSVSCICSCVSVFVSLSVLLGVRLRDSTLFFIFIFFVVPFTRDEEEARRAAMRTRLINYQVECPVSKFDLEHKFRYSGELSSALCTRYSIPYIYILLYICWLFRLCLCLCPCVCEFSTIFWLSFLLRAAMRYECRTWIRLLPPLWATLGCPWKWNSLEASALVCKSWLRLISATIQIN